MCGILGGNNSTWDYNAGLKAIRHRGPDGTRIETDDHISLGFVRLAIRDLSERAMQPMFNEDKSVAVVFNGELYGIEQIRQQLALKYKFYTTSDTEVLLNAYLEWGEKFVEKVDGMFAVAIYDKSKAKLSLYRDRVGIKPLYYFYDGYNFCFASELKAIEKTCKNINFLKDTSALYDYFTYGYIPEPKTLYKNVYKLPPAYKLKFDINSRCITEISSYWQLKVNSSQGCKKDIEEINYEIRHKIRNVVSQQLVSDVEVCTFLSGGIDSSIITATTKELGNRLKAFSIGFEIDKSCEHYDERKYAKLLAERMEIPLVQEIFTPEDLEKEHKSIAEWFDEPFAAPSSYPTYFVSKLVRKNNIKVVLTGDGGDELFGGYTRYQIFADYCKTKSINNRKISDAYYYNLYPIRTKLDCYFLEDIAVYGRMVDWYGNRKKKYCLKNIGIEVPKDYDDFWYFRQFDNPELPPITRAQVIDFHTYLPSWCLPKVDRTSMQCSIEARVPLCSREIVEYAFSLSEKDRCPTNELKGALKRAYLDIIPEEILYKPKKGFTFPPIYDSENKTSFEYRKKILEIFIK